MDADKIREIGWTLVKQEEEGGGDLVSRYTMSAGDGRGNTIFTYHLKLKLRKGYTYWMCQIYRKLTIVQDDCTNETKMVLFNGRIADEEELKTITKIAIRG